MSSPVTAAGIAPGPSVATPARHFTEPYRQLGAFALLTANAVFLFLGVSGLIFVLDGWADSFGLRSAVQFGTFVGPLSLGLPFAAMLVATHLAPMVPRSRAILIAVLVEYGVSAVFGVITFLGAFAHGLSSVRETLEGVLGRAVWLGLLVLAVIVVYRAFMGLYPPAPPRVRPASYAAPGYPAGSPVYGRPYPGQPVYPPGTQAKASTQAKPSIHPKPAAPATYQPGSADPSQVIYQPPPVIASEYDDALFESPASDGGWPVVPPPPVPAPLAIPSQPIPTQPLPTQESPAQASPTQVTPGPFGVEYDPTVRVSPLTGSLNGDATRLMPLTPPSRPAPPEIPQQPEKPDGPAEPPARDSER